MIYILTILVFICGVGYHVMQVVKKLRKDHPVFGFREIFKTFFQQEWDSLISSALLLSTILLALFIMQMTHVKLPSWYVNGGHYVIVLVLGYAGQRIAYSFLGTAASELEKKAELLKNV